MIRALACLCAMGCGQILGITDPTPGMGAPTDGAFNPDGRPPPGMDGKAACATAPTFGATTNYGVAAGATAFDVGDLDHDGLTDVVISGSTSSSLVIMHGTGGGALGRQQLVQLPTGETSARQVRAVDVDHDTFTDLVYAAFGTDAAIFVQRQDPTHPGNFLAAVHVVDLGPMFGQFDVGDIDGDSLLDIVSPNTAMNGVSVLLQLSASPGTFGTAIDVPLGNGGGPFEIAAIADLDHDGKRDVIGLINQNVEYALQKPGVTFGAALSLGPSSQVMDFAVGDIDGDGFDDVLIGANTTAVFFQNPAAPGTFTAGETLFPVQKFGFVSDINGDGRLDVIGNGDFELQCSPPAPTRTFLMQQLGGGTGYGDLTGDGKQERITLDGQNAIMGVAIQQ